ncbi:CSEP0361 putative effector protein [Blumeria hordei DH14]|uniref:CSEP0361 putative effector protein n=1 Tax=Blumeria graminis f. sp. hordei (strain DH14) TaxID=546991 RepID=N1JA95_BLUG1|nr:CSEP0361 putative effector protein [Blumeria hordei DH14]
MKFLHLTGIIVLLSQATSISAAVLLPRSSSSSQNYGHLINDVRAAISRIHSNGTPLKSPNSQVKDLARRLGYSFLIPISLPLEQNSIGCDNYVTNDSNRNLNLWVTTTKEGVQTSSALVDG